MDFKADDLPKTLTTTRHKCPACFKQYKKKEHLIEHMKASYHSVHQPKCGVCQKHCKSFESLREHITGPLPKANCSRIYADRGCNLCMKIFDSPDSLNGHKEICCLPAPAPLVSWSEKYSSIVCRPDSLNGHKEICCLPAPAPLGAVITPFTESEVDIPTLNNGKCGGRGPEAVAIDCEMVGGGSDGSLDLCARVCLIDEDENLIFHTYVQPQIPVTNYRCEITGITEEHLKNAIPLKEVQERLLQILYNGESIGRIRLDGGKGRLLVGHGLEHDLDCLRMNYPDHLLRDTANYRPLMKTNLVSHSLKYLTQSYLGYDIQSGVHDPFEDCVSVMRLYKRMRAQDHGLEGIGTSPATSYTRSMFTNSFDSWESKELENMTPDKLLEISSSNYRCWCLDLRQELQN